MNGYEAYKLYLAIKNHFSTESYDYFKYQGKLNTNTDTFKTRNDKIFFDKLAKHPNLIDFLVANLSKNPKAWIKDLAYDKKAENIYNEWSKKQQSLSYNFKEELGRLESDLDSNLICVNKQHPPLLVKYLSGSISLETICILLSLTNANRHWDKELTDDLMWKNYRNTILKYTPFMKIDKDKFRKIVVDYYS